MDYTAHSHTYVCNWLSAMYQDVTSIVPCNSRNMESCSAGCGAGCIDRRSRGSFALPQLSSRTIAHSAAGRCECSACQKLPQATCAGGQGHTAPRWAADSRRGCPHACLRSYVPPGRLRSPCAQELSGSTTVSSNMFKKPACVEAWVEGGINCTPASGLASRWSRRSDSDRVSPSVFLASLLPETCVSPEESFLPRSWRHQGRQGRESEDFLSALVSRPEVTEFGGTWKGRTGQNGCLFTKCSVRRQALRPHSCARL